MILKPSEIRYSQSSISPEFSDYFHGDILKAFENILQGHLDVSNLGRIEVGLYQGEWVCFEGNRRLFIFKQLEKAGRLNRIDVRQINPTRHHLDKKYTTTNGGTSIKVRRHPNIQYEINMILSRHQRPTSTRSISQSSYQSYDDDIARIVRSSTAVHQSSAGTRTDYGYVRPASSPTRTYTPPREEESWCTIL